MAWDAAIRVVDQDCILARGKYLVDGIADDLYIRIEIFERWRSSKTWEGNSMNSVASFLKEGGGGVECLGSMPCTRHNDEICFGSHCKDALSLNKF